jgi:senataxin
MEDVYTLIVDEAGQSIEAETLLAFQRNPRKVLLVGDTKQLPATVTSPMAEKTHYDWSMMLRLSEKCGMVPEMLTTQYRMPLAICQHPSRQYYEGRLITAQSVFERPPRKESFHQTYAIYDIKSNESRKFSSFLNVAEANHVLKIVKHIRSTDKLSSIGVITFYLAQQRELQTGAKKQNLQHGLQISTVDGFQGDECDIIIISCVRSNCNNTIGFVRDGRRLNVAITRAKFTLIILANTSVMEKGSAETKALITDAKNRGLICSEKDLRERLGIAEPAVSVPKGKKNNNKNNNTNTNTNNNTGNTNNNTINNTNNNNNTTKNKNNKGQTDKSSLLQNSTITATATATVGQKSPTNKPSNGPAGAVTEGDITKDIQGAPVASKKGRRRAHHQPARSNSQSTIVAKQPDSSSVVAAAAEVRPRTATATPTAKKANTKGN